MKTRIIARQQQVVRVDREKKGPLPADVVELATEKISALLPGVDAIIFEDYNKGFSPRNSWIASAASPSLRARSSRRTPTRAIRSSGAGVTTIKPNRSEAFAMAGRSDTGAADEPLKDDACWRSARSCWKNLASLRS